MSVFCLVAASFSQEECAACLKKKKIEDGKQEITVLFKLGGFQTAAYG